MSLDTRLCPSWLGCPGGGHRVYYWVGNCGDETRNEGVGKKGGDVGETFKGLG